MTFKMVSSRTNDLIFIIMTLRMKSDLKKGKKDNEQSIAINFNLAKELTGFHPLKSSANVYLTVLAVIKTFFNR